MVAEVISELSRTLFIIVGICMFHFRRVNHVIEALTQEVIMLKCSSLCYEKIQRDDFRVLHLNKKNPCVLETQNTV